MATAQNWQDAVVSPLRQARVALRQLDSLPLWLRPEAAALQEYIKAVELRAEKRELEWLESFSPVGVVHDRETAAAHNVLTFLDFLGTDADRVGRRDVEALLFALRPETKDS